MPNTKATKALQKRSDAALESFHRYYATLWGEERWQSLFAALILSTRYCALVNRFAIQAEVQDLLKNDFDHSTPNFKPILVPMMSSERKVHFPVVVQSSTSHSFPVPSQVSSNKAGGPMLSHWNMDLASVLAACVLRARPGNRVLDLCAAPGGKSLALAQMLWPELYADHTSSSQSTSEIQSTCLHSNEFDHARHKRLLANMQSYLPPSLFADDAVKVVRIDGTDKSAVHELPLGPGSYDKVLLDAPCSSERHVIQAHVKAASAGQVADEIANWKSSHTKSLAKTQAALLMTALKAVKLGGKVLYATCSISQEENDNVIERAMEAVKRERKKNSDSAQSAWKIRVDSAFESDASGKDLLESMTEATKYGRIALPDHPAGGRWGPLYFCLIQKVPYKGKTEVAFSAEAEQSRS